MPIAAFCYPYPLSDDLLSNQLQFIPMNTTESNVLETPPVRPSRWLPLLLAIAIFMQMLDATILNTALPEIAKDFQVSPLNMQLAAISYTLTVALLIP